ncbi:MAG TPA: hypothetical protein VMH83_07490, partial [Candidatus Acidoferrum sp.]|nr:hypothetical protein [Candidatus Acidoferrum sp.]
MWAQTPNSVALRSPAAIGQVLPADIPLDVNAIFKPLQPATTDSSTTQAIIEQMVRNHYSHIQFNDAASGRILDGYIKALDGSRMYFTQADIQEFEQYRNKLDDQLKAGDLRAGYLMFNRAEQRLIERL